MAAIVKMRVRKDVGTNGAMYAYITAKNDRSALAQVKRLAKMYGVPSLYNEHVKVRQTARGNFKPCEFGLTAKFEL